MQLGMSQKKDRERNSFLSMTKKSNIWLSNEEDTYWSRNYWNQENLSLAPPRQQDLPLHPTVLLHFYSNSIDMPWIPELPWTEGLFIINYFGEGLIQRGIKNSFMNMIYHKVHQYSLKLLNYNMSWAESLFQGRLLTVY